MASPKAGLSESTEGPKVPEGTPEFDKFASQYESVINDGVGISGEAADYFAHQKARYLAALLPTGFSGKVLDFGCGIGLVSTALAVHLPHATLDGFDPSAQSIARVPPEIRARGTFACSMSELSNDYQLAVVANVLHHIPPLDRAAAVASIAVRLAPGGKLVVVEHNPWNPATRYIVATCALDHDAILLRKRESISLLRGAGLAINRTDYIAFFPAVLAPLRRFEKALRQLPLGAQYVVVADR